MTTDSNRAETGAVLITGANGHLGRRLVEHLAGQYPVKAVVRSERARRQLEAAPKAAGIEIVTLDYGDREALAAAAEGCSHAVHLVGIIKESMTTTYRQAHEEATQALIAAVDAVRLQRIIYLSIYGSHPDSGNACLASKGRAERLLLQANTAALILRVPMVLGEGDYAAAALRKRVEAPVNLLIRGSSLEQPIYAGDVISAIAAGISRADLDDVVLDLAGPESLSRSDLTLRAGEIMGRRPRPLSLPLAVGTTLAFLLETISRNPPLTRAMLGVLDHDDDVDTAGACNRLGIELTPLDEMLLYCLDESD